MRIAYIRADPRVPVLGLLLLNLLLLGPEIGRAETEAQAPNAGSGNGISDAPTSPDGPYSAKQLARRPDDYRPSDQLLVMLFGRPLTIGGEYTTRFEYLGNPRLGTPARDDTLLLRHRVQVEFLYSLTDTVSLLLEAKPSRVDDLYAEDGDRNSRGALERGETWLYARRLFDSGFSLQLGRQNFRDKREWWWDDELDAVRLHYDLLQLHLEAAVAHEIATISTDRDDVEPDMEDVFRVLARGQWTWARKQRLEVFFLHQNDRSETERLGDLVERDQQDESDAKLTWVGLRAIGRWKIRPYGKVYYWLDTAFVRGDEILLDYDDAPAAIPGDRRIVGGRVERNVRGWASDLGLTWNTRLPWRPSFTLGYAFGSGDRSESSGPDRSFRQTGLHDNNGRFRGVDRFRYYGEVLEPELSNLHILTATIGLPILHDSSIELLYHAYWQAHPARFLRDSNIKARPRGTSRTIGQEWDLVLGLEDWQPFEIEIIGGIFRAGSAYGSASSEIAYLAKLEFAYNF